MGPGGIDDRGRARTRARVEENLPRGSSVAAAGRLRGGWTSEIRLLHITGTAGADGPERLVLRSFTKPFFVRHAEGLLTREADVLRLLAGTDIPAAELRAVDATAARCDHPSLLMSFLPGSVRLDEREAGGRVVLLARRLAAVHGVWVPPDARPRTYQAWTSPEGSRPAGGVATGRGRHPP